MTSAIITARHYEEIYSHVTPEHIRILLLGMNIMVVANARLDRIRSAATLTAAGYAKPLTLQIILQRSDFMMYISRRSSNFLSVLGIVTLGLALAACAGGDYASTGDGDDSLAKQQLDAAAMGEQTQANKSEQAGTLSVSPKRGPQDPIYVTLAPPVLDKKMQEAEKPKGSVAQQIRKELSSDPVIQLLAGNKRATAGKSSPASSIADVTVASKVSMMEKKGMNRKTGKAGKITTVVMEATITSQSPPAIYTVYESGHVLQNTEVSKRFAKQIRQVIVEKVGPQIPAH
jgi:hypothetical protein